MRRMPADGSNAAMVWIVPLLALAAGGIALFGLTAWIEGVRFDTGQIAVWLGRLGEEGALQTLSNAAEVVAGMLGIVLTVVAIVVELAATRYTHRITELFVREPINGIVIGFYVLTAIYCFWISATMGPGTESAEGLTSGVAMAMVLVTLCLALLLPYFAFVFAFLQPVSVVDRIRAASFDVVRRATEGYRHGLRAQVIAGIEQLEDVALNAMDHKDRTISMAGVNALASLLHDYEEVRHELDDAWFEVDRSLDEDPDFVAMAPRVRQDLTERRLWLEMKILRQFHSVYVEALNRMRAIAYLISLDLHRAGSEALQRRRLDVFDLTVRFFNSFLRAAINAHDVRTAYYTLHHYRELLEETIRSGEGDRAVEIAGYFRYYGQVAFGAKLPFVLEAVAYDMTVVNEVAFEVGNPAAEALLEVFLTVDKESDSPLQEESLRGVRRAQVQLATFFLERGDDRHARLVFADMEHERPERLASIRDELLSATAPDYWEITDRGVNFAYLPPGRRVRVEEFFSWFGSRLPARRTGGAHEPSFAPPEVPQPVPAPEPRRAAGEPSAG